MKQKTVLQQQKEGDRAWKKLRMFAAKGLYIFFMLMILFTIISRSATALTVAQVWVEVPTSRRIEHVVMAQGMVEKNRETALLTEPGILVESVYTNTGEKIMEGEVLAKLDMNSLMEQICELENDIRVLQLQNKAVEDAKWAAEEKSRKDVGWAAEDYERTIKEQQAAVADAKETLQNAQGELDSFMGYYGQNYPNKNDMASDGNSRETFDQILAERKAALAVAEDLYDTAVKQQEETVRLAVRKLEAAEMPQPVDYTSEINGISIASIEKKLKKLKELQMINGEITAPSKGVITEVSLAVGQKTTETAGFTMADLSSGMRYKAIIAKENVKYVSIGDEVVLESSGRKVSDLTVDALTILEDGTMEISVVLTGEEFSIGDEAAVCIEKDTEKYPLVVPLTSLREESGRNYILVLDSEETVLGEQYRARKVYVTVSDKNFEYAAVSAEDVTGHMKVIVDSDRYVEAGGRVRLRES